MMARKQVKSRSGKADEIKELARLAALYAVADPGKDARDDFFRRVAKLA